MKKSNTDTPPVLAMADAEALPQKERISLFKSKTDSHQRLFIELAKLFRAIERGLRANQQIFPLLMKAGVKKGSISNASQAARVFDLVEQGHLTEAEFDSFTWADCVAIVRAISSGSKKPLNGELVAIIVRNSHDFQPDLVSLYETGRTVDEQEQHEAKQAAEAAKQAAPPTDSPTPAIAEGDSPSGSETPASPSAPPTEAPSGESTTPAAPPSNIITMPPPAKATAEDAIKLIAALEAIFIDLPLDEAIKALPALDELHANVHALAAPAPAKTRKTKKAAKAA